MARIKNCVLPPEVTEELVAEVEMLSPDTVVEWARRYLPGGFTKPDIIRQRIEAKIRSDALLDSATVQMLTEELDLSPTVAALSLNGIRELTPQMVVLCGPGTWILALLVDPREEVHKFGAELALKPFKKAPEDVIVAAQGLFLRFVEDLFYFPVGVYPEHPHGDGRSTAADKQFFDDLKKSAMADLTQQVGKQHQRIEHLTNELHQQKLRHEAKQKEQAQALERERKELFAHDNGLKDNLRKAVAEKEAIAAKLNELNQSFEHAVAARVREETSAAIRKWLEEPTVLEANLHQAQANGDDVLSRAQRALDAQARQDRHTGNRVQLEQHLADMEAMRQRLTEAFNTAIKPLSEVKEAMRELNAEIEKLRRVVRHPRKGSDTETRLLGSINEARTWEEIRLLAALLDRLADSSLLEGEERRILYTALHRKLSLLAETDRPKAGEAESGWSLRDYIYRNRTALLVLDGHNVLYSLPDVFSPFHEDGHPRRKAREALVEMTRRLVNDRTNVQTRICFDGSVSDTRRASPNLEIIYSGGTGEHRADELIISQLQFKDLQSLDQKVFVVSDDRAIRAEILRTGAKFVRTDLYAVLLKDFGCLDVRS